jgi:transposase
MRGEVLGLERRRRWSDEQKLALILEVGVRGATVTQVAQRHEITRQQIYAWRHELKRKGLWRLEEGPVFLPVELPLAGEPETGDPVEEPATGSVEIVLRNGRQLRVAECLSDAALSRLIRLVETA